MSSGLEIRPDDHVQGGAQAPLTLLEYGDYQCPYCADAFVAIRDAQRELGEQLRFVFRNLPLVAMHPDALPAAQAAEAAGLQGRFWEMHAALYTHQRDLSRRALLELAEELGLDLPRFERDMTSDEVLRRLALDARSAAKLHVPGTPSLFVNGQPLLGAYADGALTRDLTEMLRSGSWP